MTLNFVNRILFFFLLFQIKILSQNYFVEQLELADSLFNSQNYFDAITEYKRLLFFDSLNHFRFYSNYQIGLCYKNGAKYSDAIRYFVLAENNASNDEQLFNSKVQQVRTNILRRTISRAEKILSEIETDKRFEQHKREIKYWRAWSFIFSDKWKDAYRIFSEIGETNLAQICLNTHKKLYSVEFAKYSSMIIPGLGQFYTGEYLSGLLSIAWNVFAGYLTINAFNQERIFDGIVTANLLWFRFYRGNFQNAEKFAEEKNTRIINETLFYLQNEFNGIKP
ncbi:MAG: hypothetical protein ACUVRG_08645 [Ignavibacterium sp.]|uniref:hypothetical protein n=1 Tax=Ignavibacterium sp. TaxID=2651167 RepID=UPI0040494795